MSISLFKRSGTKTAIRKAPTGIRILLTKKSAASKTDFPRIVTSDQTPKESAEGIPRKKISSPTNQEYRLRLRASPLDREATMISSIEKAEVSVANKNRTINTSRNRLPNGMCSNTEGSMINSRPGPAVGSNPREKTAGKIASPANKETSRLSPTMEPAERTRFSCLPR